MLHHLFILLISSITFLLSCETIKQPDKIEAAKAKWEASEISNYSADIERVCFCPPPARYTMLVQDGKIIRITSTDTGEEIKSLAGYSTFNELFTWLERIAEQSPRKLDLEFHPELGYPTLIDYNQSDMIADEELLLKVLDFEKK